jgi:excisionase family DNA binding protein
MIYTVKAVAELVQVSDETVLRWINQGELIASDCSRGQGRKPRWRILEDDLKSFLRMRRNRPAKEVVERRRKAVGDDVIQFFT